MKRIPVGLTVLLVLSLAISAFSVQANSHKFQEVDPTPTTQNIEGLQQQAEQLSERFTEDTEASNALARFSNIPGYAVYDMDGGEVGRIHSVMLDGNGQVAYIVLRADYQFETDGQFIPVPWAAIDVMSRQEILDQYGDDMPALQEATPVSQEETPIVPTPEFPRPTPVEPGVVVTPTPVDPDEAPTPIEPGSTTLVPLEDDEVDETPEAPANNDQGAALGQQEDQFASGSTHWNRQFALVLNVERQVLQNAPTFDDVLAENWGQADWQNTLNDYWGQYVTTIPETGQPGVDILVQVLDVRGMRVEDRNGQLIGRVFEVVMRQPSNQIAYVVVETGGEFGINAERVAVPQEQLEMRVMEGQNVLVLTADRQMFDEAPRLQTEADILILYTDADPVIRQYWGIIIEDVDVTPVAPVTTPENDQTVVPTPWEDPTPFIPQVTEEENDTVTAPITTPEFGQTVAAPMTTPEITPTEDFILPPTAEATPILPTPVLQQTPVAPEITPEITPVTGEGPVQIPETGLLEVGLLRFSDIPGLAVYDQQGEEIGRIHSILMDPNGRLAYLVLRADTELMVDGQFVAVPWLAVDVMSRSQVLEQFDMDVQTETEMTPETPMMPIQTASPESPVQLATPVQQVTPVVEDDQNKVVQDPFQMISRSQWDRQFALVLNVERMAVENAPAFDAVLVENWDDIQWRDNLNQYWEQNATLVPDTGDQELFHILDIRGLPVEDQNGEFLGRVLEAVIAEPDFLVDYLVIETGGIFGIDTERTAVPQQHFDLQQVNGRIVLVLTADRELFDQAPRLETEADLMNLQDDQDLRQYWQTDIETEETAPTVPVPEEATPTPDTDED